MKVMEDSPLYRKGEIIEARNYLKYPLSFKTMKFLIEEVEDIKGKSNQKNSFDEKDFHEELRRIGKLSLIYDNRYLYPAPQLKGIGFIGSNKKEKNTAWNNFNEYGIYGNIEKKFTYFTTDTIIALNHTSIESPAPVELIEIDL